MPTLNDYIVETRRLLHDVSGNFWTTQEITDYVNDGRTHVVQDSGCKRVIQSYTMQLVKKPLPTQRSRRATTPLMCLTSTFTGVIVAFPCTTWRGQTSMPSYVFGKTTMAGRLASQSMVLKPFTLALSLTRPMS
jgi:hypothetical protein